MQRLLVSVRGPNEAFAAAKGGAHIADVEHPSSALGTPYPLNIKAIRDRLDAEGFSDLPISTNIGEEQRIRSSASQAALGVAVAGADYVKCGFAGLDPKAAAYLGRSLVRTVKEWRPECKVYPAVFPEEEFSISFDPLTEAQISSSRSTAMDCLSTLSTNTSERVCWTTIPATRYGSLWNNFTLSARGHGLREASAKRNCRIFGVPL